MTRSTLIIVLFFMPLTLQAQVYRCDTLQGTIYSQMPCDENAERLPQYDEVVEENSPAGADEVETAPAPSPMENFISTLRNQRNVQLLEIDGTISDLQKQLNATGDESPDELTREGLTRQLAALTDERRSIDDQYEALIREATQRTGSEQASN